MTVPHFESARVIIVGDVMLDEHVRGIVRRISPEAPVPVLEFESRSHRLGGAANVAQVIRAMGARAAVVGVCGRDAAAETLRSLLEAGGIDQLLITDPQRPTTLKTRVLAGEQQICRIDQEARHDVPDGLAEEVVAAVRSALGAGASALVMSDYGKGTLPAKAIADVLSLANGAAIPVVVDPSFGDPARYAGATVMKPNESELVAMAGLGVDGDPARAAAIVQSALGDTSLLVTRGQRGMRVYAGGNPVDLPADVHLVSDVTGAGDTVGGVLALGLASGLSLVPAATLANRAGGLAVTKPGTTPVTRAELVEAVEQHCGR